MSGSVLSVEPAWDSLSPSLSLCPSPAHVLSLCLKINKLKKKKWIIKSTFKKGDGNEALPTTCVCGLGEGKGTRTHNLEFVYEENMKTFVSVNIDWYIFIFRLSYDPNHGWYFSSCWSSDGFFPLFLLFNFPRSHTTHGFKKMLRMKIRTANVVSLRFFNFILQREPLISVNASALDFSL